jgi:plasmid stabilization system protein ParE
MKVGVRVKPLAEQAIIAAGDYIRLKGYPDTADRFVKRMRLFSKSLGEFPDKYPLCRFKQFSISEFRCAVFEHIFIFVYRVENDELIVYNVIHVKRLG